MKINVTVQGKMYSVEIEDINARPVIATINGEQFEVFPEESAIPAQGLQKPSHQVSVPAAASGRMEAQPCNQTIGENDPIVKAPIPGVILSIHVNEGDQVSEGDQLFVLEAMKMKNIIHASHSGIVKRIFVSSGDGVSHNQKLLEFESQE